MVCSFLLSWLSITRHSVCLYVATISFCNLVFCPKLGLYLFPFQSLYLFYNLAKCFLLFFFLIYLISAAAAVLLASLAVAALAVVAAVVVAVVVAFAVVELLRLLMLLLLLLIACSL